MEHPDFLGEDLGEMDVARCCGADEECVRAMCPCVDCNLDPDFCGTLDSCPNPCEYRKDEEGDNGVK